MRKLAVVVLVLKAFLGLTSYAVPQQPGYG